MIDTLKLFVPLSESQHKKLLAFSKAENRWQWAKVNPYEGLIDLVFVHGTLRTDSHSFHREIKWAIPPDYSPEACLAVEFSIPKYWYGHNIHLLYGWVNALEHFRQTFNKQVKLRGKNALPPATEWQIRRADVCYAWRLPNQECARQILESIKHLKFPRKSPSTYPNGVLYKGATYSLKYYLKLPEFQQHDKKALQEQKASEEWIDYLEKLAQGVLRVEATLRYSYLKRSGTIGQAGKAPTVADLATKVTFFEWEGNHPKNNTELMHYGMVAANSILHRMSQEKGWNGSVTHPLTDGMEFSTNPCTLEINGTPHDIPALRGQIRILDAATYAIATLLNKHVGTQQMRTVDKVQAALREHYKSVKAARLTAFWLYVKQFGTEEAKAIYGNESFYTARSDLKKAGVSLLEPPQALSSNVVPAEVLEQFRIAAPSRMVTNPEDDWRDHPNILNLPIQA